METVAPNSNQMPPYKLPFTKMHGLGNDFVMVKDVDLDLVLRSALAQVDEGRSGAVKIDLTSALSQLAQTLCDRRFGIGADGLIVAVSPQRAAGLLLEKIVAAYPSYEQCELAWIYINSDGSSSDMCGNGLRCLAYFARVNSDKESESHWPQADKFKVATRAYPVAVTVLECKLCSAGGGAHSSPLSLVRMVRTQLAAPEIKFVAEKLTLGDITLSATAIDMGNPHCVIFDCAELELTQYQGCMHGISGGASAAFVEKFPSRLLDLAHQIQGLSIFPQGVNVEFVLPQGRDRAVVYVVERGCGPTLACASGAAAVVVAGVIEERLNRQCCVILPGGELEVTWSSLDNLIELNGPAQIAFSGEFPLGDSFYSSDLLVKHSSCESREELPA